MKKLLACLWVLALSMAAFCCAVADEPETFISGDWEYRVLADGTAQIIDYSNYEATSIPIPDTLDDRKVTDVDPLHFNIPKKKCSAFIVSPDHPTLAVIDGVLFSKPDKRLISYPKAKAGSTYAIPQGIEIIGNLAFYNCTSLTSISIPNSVTSIRPEAFYGCSSLTSIPIPNSVTSIGNGAFSKCFSLTSIFIPNSVTSIGNNPFYDCGKITIELSSDHPVFAVIDGVLFSKPDKRLIFYPYAKEGDTYTIPQGIEIIGDSSFSGTSLTSISIPNSVTNIGDSAFYCCYSLTNISIPGSITSIGDDAFLACKSLTSISIPDGVTSIGAWTFGDCSALTSLSIPDSVTSIGIAAFGACPNLTLTVGRNSYAEQYAKEHNIPYTVQDTTENNASYALPDDSDDWKYRILADGTAQITEYSNPNATSVQIPETLNGMKVTDVAENAFLLCLNNSSFVVSPDHPTLAVIDGVLFSKPDKRLISYPKAKEGDSYVIPQGIEIIGKFAFSYCTSLTSISLPNSVTSIENNAFAQCSSLTSISIPNSVTSIGNEAFYNCSSLTSISIPDSVTSIGVGAFADCSSLTSISIPDGVTSIEYATFADCISLTSISIPNSVTSIDYWAFSNCSALTSLSIPDSVTSISDGAFNNCPNLTLTVGRNSYAEQYAKNHNISYTYKDANDWLTK